MFATVLIVFREVLEAALIIGVVMAATRGLRRRNTWMGLGIGAGVLGAVLVATFADAVSAAAAGMGQELFNATVLFVAVILLGWHNIWMGRHGRAMSHDLAAVGESVRTEQRPISALAIVVGVAVLREGSEVVLFLYGIAAAQGTQASAMLAGGALGMALGAAAGAMIYFGLVRFAGRYLFAITGALILFLAAGMAAQGARFLSQAGYLPVLGQRVWDTSSLISDQGPLGTLLHVLVGYTARPDGIQILFYAVTLVSIGGVMYLRRKPRNGASMVAAVVIGATVAIHGTGRTRPALAADLVVYSPIMEDGEFALEARGNVEIDDTGCEGAARPAERGGYATPRTVSREAPHRPGRWPVVRTRTGMGATARAIVSRNRGNG